MLQETKPFTNALTFCYKAESLEGRQNQGGYRQEEEREGRKGGRKERRIGERRGNEEMKGRRGEGSEEVREDM